MKIENIKIEDLKPYSLNSKQHPQSQIEGLAESIRRFGVTQPIVIDDKNEIIIGHGRLEGAKLAALKEMPCVRMAGLSENEVKALRLIDNRISETGWDTELLNLDIQNIDFDFTPFNIEFSDLLDESGLNENEGLTDPDEVPEIDEDSEPVTKLGDIWQLGDHRLMCGDSTSKEQVEKLMNGEKADMVFTDPPYRMQVEGGSNQPIGRAARKLGEAIKSLCDFDPDKFLDCIATVFDKKTMNSYIFCNKDLVPDYLNWAVSNGYSFNILVWKKPNAIPLGGSHRPDVEYLLLFRKSATWNNAVEGVVYSKVLDFGRENSTPHPTMKPVGLIENEILISSTLHKVVFDFFLGSGSTLIACEKTNRKCYGMELDQKYCDVIIKRWQDFSGKEAKLIENINDKNRK